MTEHIFDGTLGSLLQWSYDQGYVGQQFPSVEPFFARKAVGLTTAAFGGLATADGTGAYNPVYGAVVYDQLNRETNAHAILKKTGWDRSGFRITTSGASSSATDDGKGGYEVGSIYTTALSDGTAPNTGTVDSIPKEVFAEPTFLITTIEATQGVLARSKHDDGLNLWDWLAALSRDRHQQLLNKELLRSPHAESATINGSSADAKAVSTGSGKGLESIRRFLSSYEEATGKATGANKNNYSVYKGVGVGDRTSSTDAFNAVVVVPDGSSYVGATHGTTNQPFQLAGVNALLDNTQGQGGSAGNGVFLTGRDTHRAINDEVATALRGQLEVVEAKLDYNGLSPSALLAGRDVSYVLRGYQQTPIVVDRMVPSQGNTVKHGGAGAYAYQDGGTGLSDFMYIDQRDAEIAVMYPTMFSTADNPAYLGKLSSVGVYTTIEQLKFTRTNRSGVLTNISA